MAENEKSTKVKKNKGSKSDKQRGPFKKTRANVVLSKSEVKEIKKGRKDLRKRLKKAGIRSKKDFELTASSMGLYFDKKNPLAIWWLLFGSKALWALVGAALMLLFLLYGYSQIVQLQGHFTINLSDDMMKRGFRLSEDEQFTNPSFTLYSEPRENAPAVSISKLPEDVMQGDGQYDNETFFAYSYYLRYEGDIQGFYDYEIKINAESLDAGAACWIMLFDQGKMKFYAKMGEDGKPEAVPAQDDNSRGFPQAYFMEYSENPSEQYEVIAQKGDRSFYRVIPYPFINGSTVMRKSDVPIDNMEVHKFTVVLWLEGEDPECTNDIIGGHLGLEMNFTLQAEDDESGSGIAYEWDKFMGNLKGLLPG